MANRDRLFAGARLKIDRANHHIKDAERQIGLFLLEYPDFLRVEVDADGKVIGRAQLGKKLPSDIPLAIGDALHNARTALDHLAWELVGIDGGTQDRYLQFPMRHNRRDFVAACNGIKTPSSQVKSILKSLEAFPGGTGEGLYILHTLDNLDKHTVITPILRLLTIRQPVIIERSLTITADAGIRIVESTDPDDDANAPAPICFGEVEFVANEPVLPTLSKLSHAALNAIDVVERALA